MEGYPSAVVAAEAAEHLEGLGDYTDATGVKCVLRAQEPNEQGHFGRATAQTHGLYETLPAPRIAYGRVVADLAASHRGGHPSAAWIVEGIAPQPSRAARDHDEDRARRAQNQRRDEQLHEPELDGVQEVEPEESPAEEGPLPTANLLGWSPSRQLTANQLREVERAIDPEGDAFYIKRYCIKRELYELVERRLRECRRYKMTHIPKGTTGSIVQQVAWKPTRYVTSRLHQFIEMDGTAITRTALPLRAAVAAKVHCYTSVKPDLEDECGIIHHT